MLIRTDPSSDVPLFAQIAASVRADAAAGRLRPGDRLPSAREVAAALEVNLHTVLHAYQQLRDEGLLNMHRGRGAVATSAVADLAQLRDDIAALTSRARRLGLSAEALGALIRHSAEPTPEVSS
ncbi:GntR family transcriptional regulator [Microbacterium sp. VKM Ac-2870]|uniref:GntR family transcriptional regulator n=1 Tax=Microbacterium sp. VKM Ac-2870 TaxID=2783825 RepID=UPI00188C2F19|nr:GntR family transcriptional regulator [Microbacterium sp. VKM Ac-2870]MBF4563247.1 GntR family transcriptional regulator [Microbacterium sp. VKM Ac-2870]